MKKQLLLITLSFVFSSIYASDIEISFAAKGASTTVGSVKVENLTKGTIITLNGTDVLVLTTPTGVEEITKNESIQVVPNPVNNEGEISFNAPISGIANISIVNEAGTVVALQTDNLQSGSYTYTVSGLPSGIFIITITGEGYSLHTKLISTGTTSNTISLKQTNGELKPIIIESKLKSLKSSVQMAYSSGDNLKFTATSGTLTAIITDIPTATKIITFSFAIYMSDIDGNSYKTVVIGTQTWMAENLNVTKYNDGTTIPNVTDATAWGKLTTGAVCTYNNTTNADTIKTYGRLYNWFAGNTNKLCPTGWHVPSDNDWTTLCTYLFNNGYSFGGSGLNYGKALAVDSGWPYDPTAGNVGNDQASNNSTGFTGLPAGFRRNDNGKYYEIGRTGQFWSTSANDLIYASNCYLYYNEKALYFSTCFTNAGLSVRCVKN